MNQNLLKKFTPVIVLFVLINLLVFVSRNFLTTYGFDISFLLVANVILFLLSLFGFFIQTRGTQSPNIHAFIRGLYLSLLLKMFVIIGAIFIYIFVFGKVVNEPSLFTAMAIYLIYTSIEVTQLMKIARKKPDA